ncbi:MAG: excinuclease ABC subunit C [Candidatus Doudnabacteria bacterium RIFCSPLOWO2_02_FULL_42_9]|uniref:UvrABC system protein C n=1 Tax=Candidatus Doudnabacteria bacterium RIFCSPHIGHO2_01_FULL_41_86 TaxID=1817821 RepID=A0A1F5NA37_9BACT|nr:MAG: excinuclease ABC subunit C [Candidatus Doudnabacteria bacterium RIFCSPHIGHO2_01_FULL_41_86]OGE75520.1 MAG: excinuclease ABC subunit C [Candidatus Doudnabacteria bacterium RIFCSPHIGHO2_01_43_10]OGE85477.1 MAG: excinuclease ABC subunit C [Candidatus Doudnabacteria bacterium RIFCSPHIGHO2_12_FULL_42_22]OGE87015.1 MAG: excinuclease ABC subunit C [Candidatus Doudnabacteria bacterium RIFCSPHIGHO2_02_FULL_42_25]OGE92614.1 MAG: excinuclease ABC subunit C [Candidatus Doudnabacteria bacterium RIFC
MSKQLEQKIKDLPQKPGVYVFKDAKGLVLYVGKAIKLKNRVSSYFKRDGDDGRGPRIQQMISLIRDLNYTVTDNETESLILEKNFISQLKPKYNVDLRDDKNYLFIKINIKDEIPTIGYERKLMDRSSRYFGPYTSGLAIKDTLRMLRNIFPYCSNKKIGNKPCFFYHIGKCPGVCFGKISTQEYRDNYIKKIIQFLEGRQSQVLKDLQKQMRSFASHKQFEKAAKVRNQIFALNRVLERQKLVYPKKLDQDVFSVYTDLPAMPRVKQSDKAWQAGGVASINLFMIREGKLIQKENFIMENTKQVPVDEILQSFLERYYLEASSIPKEVLLPAQIIPDELYPVFIGRRFPKFTVPVQGQRLQLLKLGQENAKQYLESTTDKHLLEEARLLASLKELQRVLDLPNLPGRIEAYDISNIQGTNPVGSMVVFDFARPKKSDYRKFKINKKQTPDDFAMMREMLERRFRNDWPLPDLILIDGGKGQLNAALSVLQVSGSRFQVIGLAKRLEEIFTPLNTSPLILPTNSQALYLLQRIRDEAHRFGVKYHRHLRSKGSLSSVLDQISGIGPAKKKTLLQKFGSAAKVRSASLTELAAIVGSKTAEKIKASL